MNEQNDKKITVPAQRLNAVLLAEVKMQWQCIDAIGGGPGLCAPWQVRERVMDDNRAFDVELMDNAALPGVFDRLCRDMYARALRIARRTSNRLVLKTLQRNKQYFMYYIASCNSMKYEVLYAKQFDRKRYKQLLHVSKTVDEPGYDLIPTY